MKRNRVGIRIMDPEEIPASQPRQPLIQGAPTILKKPEPVVRRPQSGGPPLVMQIQGGPIVGNRAIADLIKQEEAFNGRRPEDARQSTPVPTRSQLVHRALRHREVRPCTVKGCVNVALYVRPWHFACADCLPAVLVQEERRRVA